MLQPTKVQKYKISEFAKLNNTTIRTLQYYDEVGILKPAMKDSKGFRYYFNTQSTDYKLINTLIASGIKISDLKNELKADNKSYKSLYIKFQYKLKTSIENQQKILKEIQTKFEPKTSEIFNKFEKTNLIINQFYYYKTLNTDLHDISNIFNIINQYFNSFPKTPTFIIRANLFEKKIVSIGVLKEGNLKVKDKYKGIFELSSQDMKKGILKKVSTGTIRRIYKNFTNYINIDNPDRPYNEITILIHALLDINQKNIYETLLH